MSVLDRFYGWYQSKVGTKRTAGGLNTGGLGEGGDDNLSGSESFEGRRQKEADPTEQRANAPDANLTNKKRKLNPEDRLVPDPYPEGIASHDLKPSEVTRPIPERGRAAMLSVDEVTLLDSKLGENMRKAGICWVNKQMFLERLKK